MPLINDIDLVDRNNRPPVESRVMLRTLFINEGEQTNPYAISSVHIFQRAQNLSPANVLNSNGLVASDQASQASMVLGVTGTGELGTDTSFDLGKYKGEILDGDPDGFPQPCSGVSGVYALNKGEFFCVLDGFLGADLSGFDGITGEAIQNSASGAFRYIEVWTVKFTAGSAWKTFINHFELFDDSFITLTEPLLLRAKNKLYNKQVILGSKTLLKIGTEITIENDNIDESVKNTFKETVVTSATVVIKKQNEDQNLPSRVTVVSSTDVRISSDNTILYQFDTDNDLTNGNYSDSNGGNLNTTDLGAKRGTYSLQVEYDLLSEKIVSPLMYFIVKIKLEYLYIF